MRAARPLLVSLATAIVTCLVAAVVLPAGAATDPRAEREAVRAKRAQLARQLDSVKASDAQLTDAIDALDAHIAVQSRKVVAARQAVAAAEAEMAEYQRQLDATRAHMAHLREVLIERAVQAFVHPGGGNVLGEIMSSDDFGQAARKHALLDQVTSNDRDVIDELNATSEDLADLKEAAAAASSKALARRHEADAQLAELETARAAVSEKRSALDARRRELESEIAAQARADARLTEIIRSAEARSRSIGVRPGAVSAAGLIWPVSGVVTSEYGMRWGRLHAGIDIGAPTGRPIMSALSGVVIYAGQMSGYGNVVVVDHGGGFTTVYAHQSRIGTRNGASVDRGQVIGYVGSTGRSTGPHLHFETRVNGSARNPRNYLP